MGPAPASKTIRARTASSNDNLCHMHDEINRQQGVYQETGDRVNLGIFIRDAPKRGYKPPTSQRSHSGVVG
jgi:hypothetical protein